MAEQKHILEILLDKVRKDIPETTEVYLARDDQDNEVIAVNTKDYQRGLPIDQIVHSFGVFRIYQSESEEEALNQLAKSISDSILNMENQIQAEEAEDKAEADKK
jgi:predicted DNA-binding transcriptional regulator